jgi:mannose-6-phosphate isomerase-like protein (cupin superfamily)
MPVQTVNLAEKFTRFSEQWKPKIAGEINDTYVKLVKFTGEFVWHHHQQEDEMFLVVKGTMRMKLRDPAERELLVRAGEFVIIPRGTEHCPVADEEAHVVLFEPKTTLNTGNVTNERTLPELERV